MNTNVSTHMSDIEQEEITMIRYEPKNETAGRFIQWIRPILKWFGFLSTLAWGAAALSPNSFGISAAQQGWVFTIACIWFFAFCAGLFNL